MLGRKIKSIFRLFFVLLVSLYMCAFSVVAITAFGSIALRDFEEGRIADGLTYFLFNIVQLIFFDLSLFSCGKMLQEKTIELRSLFQR